MSMKQWEPIDGSDIKIGDKITWGNQIFYVEVSSVNGIAISWVPGSFRYIDNDKQLKAVGSDLYPLALGLRRDIHKLVEYSEYDPKQQPYEDSDI